jgi:hypothetical protein
MATVTETYILEQNIGDTMYPSTARARLQAAIDSGAIVSSSRTPIIDGPDLVQGKTRSRIVRVFRSADDRTSFQAASLADTELQAYVISSGSTAINKVIS